ncbi:chromatin modification-related protein MEAF6-like [Cryptosporidium felis]|nr:chromatin modification-related protein MEAF6-like [Cryptosporidium felis]
MKQKIENKGKNDIGEAQSITHDDNQMNKDSLLTTNVHSGSESQKLSNEMKVLREKVRDELTDIERKIYELETFYWNQTTDIGNMLRGWDGYTTNNNQTGSISGRKSNVGASKNSCKPALNIFSEKDRWFSLSSVTSPVDTESLGTLPPTGVFTGEIASAAGSNVGSSISHQSDPQCIGSEQDNMSNFRKQRR